VSLSAKPHINRQRLQNIFASLQKPLQNITRRHAFITLNCLALFWLLTTFTWLRFVYLFAWGLTALSAQIGYIAP